MLERAAEPIADHPRKVWFFAIAVLITLTVVKPLGGIPFVGPVAFTLAAVMQLYIPLWRGDKLLQGNAFVGLDFRFWRRDMQIVAILCLITFPPYIFGYHYYMTYLRDYLLSIQWNELAAYVPKRVFRPRPPEDFYGWMMATIWFGKIVLTHSLGVALPEEAFYRGYLQPQLQHVYPPQKNWFGVKVGQALFIASALFAAGHFLGEWNPLRLGPFFPGLVFGWQRNASGTIIGSITFHALCNILGEILFTMYRG